MKRMKVTGWLMVCVILLSGALAFASGEKHATATAEKAAHAEHASGVTPEQALKKLMDGNQRFVEGKLIAGTTCNQATRERLVGGQHPYAIILSCSDSRVPPEIIFDEGLGEIFVVRVAGNVATPVTLGSIEYAAEHLGSSLIMVLGHEKCGAVKATVETKGKADGNIGSIVHAIAPALSKSNGADAESVADANLAVVKNDLTEKSPVLSKLVKEGKVKIVTAKYDIDHGGVVMMEGIK